MATAATLPAERTHEDRLQLGAFIGLLLFVVALQVSIAAANILLALTLLVWLARRLRHDFGSLRAATAASARASASLDEARRAESGELRRSGEAAESGLIIRQESLEVPKMFIPLAAYGAITLASAAFSTDPRASFVDSKQLVLFWIVPMVYDVARGARASTVLQWIISAGAICAALGIIQYGVLEYDNLGRRPQGLLGHYMTYSGLIMLVATAAAARLLYGRQERVWPALMMPALLVALALTFTRSAWVGACASIAFLLLLKDFRLVAVLPVLAALFFALAPPRITDRFYSMFDSHDPTTIDRVTMLRVGERMVAADPLTGVGPDMVGREYAQYLSPSDEQHLNPHLHNVPLQVAAERGLPALAVWIWLIATIVMDLVGRLRMPEGRMLAAAGLGAVVAMLTAGQFEYNFGDSEFLMLFLVLTTLPYAATREALAS